MYVLYPTNINKNNLTRLKEKLTDNPSSSPGNLYQRSNNPALWPPYNSLNIILQYYYISYYTSVRGKVLYCVFWHVQVLSLWLFTVIIVGDLLIQSNLQRPFMSRFGFRGTYFGNRHLESNLHTFIWESNTSAAVNQCCCCFYDKRHTPPK